jgi:glycine betaine/choline ABC-type transport system substrate-binding protein
MSTEMTGSVRSDVFQKNPKMKGVLNQVSASLDVKTMRQFNAQVDIEQEDPEDVAREHLEEKGLL